jgi:hypothetical protein
MAKALTPADIGNALADQIIKLVERKTTGAKIDKAAVKTILLVVSTRLMTYFLMRRV